MPRATKPASDGRSQPVGRLAPDRHGQVPGGQQLDALEAEPGTVHRVFGVVAECLDELGALPAAAGVTAAWPDVAAASRAWPESGSGPLGELGIPPARDFVGYGCEPFK